jgi:hypothetical protein
MSTTTVHFGRCKVCVQCCSHTSRWECFKVSPLACRTANNLRSRKGSRSGKAVDPLHRAQDVRARESTRLFPGQNAWSPGSKARSLTFRVVSNSSRVVSPCFPLVPHGSEPPTPRPPWASAAPWQQSSVLGKCPQAELISSRSSGR